MVLPPGESNGVFAEPLPVYSECLTTTAAVTVFSTRWLPNELITNIVIKLQTQAKCKGKVTWIYTAP